MKPKTYFVDGGTKNNGRFGKQWSVICVTDKQGRQEVLQEVGDKTSNEAELLAILACLRLNSLPKKIISDSQLAVNLVCHCWHTDIDRLKKILGEIWAFHDFTISWQRRERNKAGEIIQLKFGL